MSSMIGPLFKELLMRYSGRTPTALGVAGLIEGLTKGAPILHDHIAFRTFGAEGFDNDSIAQPLRDLHYVQRDALTFPRKKVNAMWYSAPLHDPPLPRLFTSELMVAELSPAAQKIIHKYTHSAGQAHRHALTCAATGSDETGLLTNIMLDHLGMSTTRTVADDQAPLEGSELAAWVLVNGCELSLHASILPWQTPSLQDYQALLGESEFAAWVLVNGYGLSHTTISVHRTGIPGGIRALNDALEKAGFKLSAAGGKIKESPDGLLLQSSTVADKVPFTFSGGEQREVAGAYIEFAERRPLPEFANMPESELEEHHRREGFEQVQADLIFESTSEGGDERALGKFGASRVLFDDSEENAPGGTPFKSA